MLIDVFVLCRGSAEPKPSSQTAQQNTSRTEQQRTPKGKQRRFRKPLTLTLTLPVEFVEEGCQFQARKGSSQPIKRALWEDDSLRQEDISQPPSKRMAL